MTEQQACTLCGAGGHTAAQYNWNKAEGAQGDADDLASPMRERLLSMGVDEETAESIAAELAICLIPKLMQREAALAKPSPSKSCTKPDCFPHCDCGSADDKAQPSPAPELERPEVVASFRAVLSGIGGLAWERILPFAADPSAHGEVIELMTVAQHDRIVGALRAENAQLRNKLKYWVGDAAQARFAELEKQEPVAFEYERRMHDSMGGWEHQFSQYDPLSSSLTKPEDIRGLRKLYAAPVAQAGQVPEIPVRKLGICGKAYDLPETKRAYTYAEQPDNLGASRLGIAVAATFASTAGDHIDRGLVLLRELQGNGFGVFELAAAPSQGGER